MSPDPNFDLISDPDATPAPAVVQLTLAAAPPQVEPAGVVTYTVVITNTLADRDLSGLVVSDTLPLELAYWPAGRGFQLPGNRAPAGVGHWPTGRGHHADRHVSGAGAGRGQRAGHHEHGRHRGRGGGRRGGGQCGDHDHRGALPGRGLCANADGRAADGHADGRAAALPGRGVYANADGRAADRHTDGDGRAAALPGRGVYANADGDLTPTATPTPTATAVLS
ncbi:MAG: DUF11 domain-containing protein [Anaerolineae bacterium]|nr:DUF11 domain-containing protein [Anaerolineae bacterium]